MRVSHVNELNRHLPGLRCTRCLNLCWVDGHCWWLSCAHLHDQDTQGVHISRRSWRRALPRSCVRSQRLWPYNRGTKGRGDFILTRAANFDLEAIKHHIVGCQMAVDKASRMQVLQARLL